jgi:hypothetical protein
VSASSAQQTAQKEHVQDVACDTLALRCQCIDVLPDFEQLNAGGIDDQVCVCCLCCWLGVRCIPFEHTLHMQQPCL